MSVWHTSALKAQLIILAVLAGLSQRALCADARIVPDFARVTDANAWHVINGEVAVSNEGDRRIVRLAPIGGNRQGSNLALALVRGVPFAQGQIELDLRGNPAGQASFVG